MRIVVPRVETLPKGKLKKHIASSDLENRMASDEETEQNPLQELYVKASTKKAALTRSKKALEFAITALREAPASDHFFQDLKRNLSKYRDNRDTVLDIYDTIQAQVADTKYKKDFAKNEAQIDSDYDKLEEATRRVIAAHHDAVTAMMSPAAPTSGGASAPQPPPPWKLQTSFQPKIPLKLTSTIQDFHCWLREFQSYFDMSSLQQADMAIQRTVLQNCLHQDFQTKITEALSGVTDIKGGLTLVEQEFNKRHPQIIRRHQLFCLDQLPDEFSFSDTITRMLTLAKDSNLVDMSRDQILCHILLRACSKDEELRGKLLEVDSDSMTLDQLIAIVERYELIKVTSKGLSKGEKAVGRRVGGKEGTMCYRCQDPNPNPPHRAKNCPVDQKSLFCRICSEAGIKLPHSHNTFATCKGKRYDEEDKKDKQDGIGRRVRARGQSPAGSPESSDSELEEGSVRRVRAEEPMSDSHADVSSDEEGLDSGNFSDNWYTDDDKDEEERYEYGEENGPVVETVTIRHRGKFLPEKQESFFSPEALDSDGLAASTQREQKRKPSLRGLVLTTLQNGIGCLVTVGIIIVVAIFLSRMGGDDNYTKVTGHDNDVNNDNSKELSLLHIKTLKSGQTVTNWVVILGFTTILSFFGCVVYHQRFRQPARNIIKENETRKKMKKTKKSLKVLRKERRQAIEVQDYSSGEESG